MRAGLVSNSLTSNVWVCLDSSLVHMAYFVPGLRRLTSKRVPNLPSSVLKCVQLQGASPPDPLTRGSAPGPRWGLRPQTPITGSHSRARHILSVPVPFLLGNEHCTSHNDFCLSPIPMLWQVGHRSPQIWSIQKFWRGAPSVYQMTSTKQ